MAMTVPPHHDPAFLKLESILGKERARELIAEVCNELGIDSVQTPNDRLAFGEALIDRGGLFEAIGRAIKVQAILHGAKPADRSPSGVRRLPGGG